jgi:hypothetical protein
LVTASELTVDDMAYLKMYRLNRVISISIYPLVSSNVASWEIPLEMEVLMGKKSINIQWGDI